MLILDILQIPLEFIKENLTGWVILILVIFIIYFICLRKYYIQREKFYDAGVILENIEEVESAENELSSVMNNNTTANKNNNNKLNLNSILDMRNSIKEYKKERKVFKNSNKVDKQFNQNNSTDSRNEKKKNKPTFQEGFENVPSTSTISTIGKSDISSSLPPITTTLFDNLDLTDTQILACKANYNQVIAQLIIDLGKLSDMSSKNRYLNLKKQFDSILATSVDKIINHLIQTIKSPRILTRTAIRTEIINTINNTLENLINYTNQELTTAMNALAMMNSTTIDYNTQLSSINNSRASLERYITIDKLVNELGYNVSVSQREISNILDKSYILPIYERNFDKISEIAKSDFNGNESNLVMKYSKAYADFLEQQKKEELNINPLSLASQIESGIVNMLSHILGSSKSENIDSKSKNGIKEISNITGEYGNNWNIINGELREQLTRDYGFTNNKAHDIQHISNNPIPKQEITRDLQNNTQLNRENIFSDPSNRGSYMINNKTQSDILEGFEDSSTTATKPTITQSSTSTTSPSLIKAFDDYNKSNNKKENNKTGTDITSKLLSGDFLQYMLDTINGYMSNGYSMYQDKINNYLGGVTNINSNDFKLEDNMIPAGFALFILSMLLYFIDVSS